MFENKSESDSADTLPEQEQKRIVDLVRLQPTKNSELQDKWGLADGSAVHQYLESSLKEYYYRDDDSYIRASNTAEEFVRDHQDVYQDVAKPNDEPETTPDLRQRDLAIALVTLVQELGHLPNDKEINEHGKYRYQRYREEFGDLFDAYQAAGVLPDNVTRADFYAEDGLKLGSEGGTKAEEGIPGDSVPSEQIEPSHQELLDEIQRFADIIDEPPTERLVVAYGRYPADEYKQAFGSWSAALETAGLDPDDIPDWNARSHTNVEVLDGLRVVADELGRTPTTTEVENHVEFSPGLVSFRFGSWGDALETAGLDPSERSSVEDTGSADSTDTADEDTGETIESDDDGGENNGPIGSVIDDTLENMLLSDDDSPV